MALVRERPWKQKCYHPQRLLPFWSVPMQRVTEFDFYELAQHIHPLTELTGPAKYTDVFFPWFQARTALSTMFTRRAFVVSRSAAQKLYQAITEFIPEDWDKAIAKLSESTEDIQQWQLSTITEGAKNLETVLAAECQVLDTYLVVKRGAYSTADLVERAHIAFGTIAEKLPDQAKADFDQAGRCVAFDLPTAAAFHIFRGTEVIIRAYYKAVTGKEPKKKMRNWFAYIKVLRQCNADNRITSFLDHLRETYRNPILHPEENVDAEQALVMFGACISVSTLMLNEITGLSSTSVPLQFPAQLP